MASSSVMPMTLGTVVSSLPREVTTSMVVPGFTGSPAAGLCEMILPSATSSEYLLSASTTLRPASSAAWRASSMVMFLKLGVSTVSGPTAMVRVMVVPFGCLVPPAGSCCSTVPSSTDSSSLGVVVTWKPACSKVNVASSKVLPTTLGTSMGSSAGAAGLKPPDTAKAMPATSAMAKMAQRAMITGFLLFFVLASWKFVAWKLPVELGDMAAVPPATVGITWVLVMPGTGAGTAPIMRVWASVNDELMVPAGRVTGRPAR